ncbi:MAG: mechanosensitive ion channel family protein [Saccharofermentans sp.]|nr:mechanosensitive ion channel family protein [Saccharofermentans sp.]
MFEKLEKFISNATGNDTLGHVGMILIVLAIMAITLIVIYFIASSITAAMHNKSKSDTIQLISGFVIVRKMPKKFTVFALFVMISFFTDKIPSMSWFISKLSVVGMIICIIILIGSVLDIINDFYSTKKISKTRPIKGPLQVVKIVIDVLLGIIILSVLMGQNPMILISGIGAFTAILSIVFKDALLGLVAGVQITSENLLQIGDWISIPSLNVEGSVTDIALISVKVTAFDNTVYTVPAYTFLSVPFKNWHNTLEKRERQGHIMITVDANSVKFDKEGLTNLTNYRNDLLDALKASEQVKEDFALQIKSQGTLNGCGIPLDIFFTTNIQDYEDYWEFVTQIYESAIASLGKYDLKPYQLTPPTAR